MNKKPMEFFKPEDFQELMLKDCPQAAADIANAKLAGNKMVIFRFKQNNNIFNVEGNLIGIKEKKCEHLINIVSETAGIGFSHFECQCGASVRPVKFEERD